MPGKILVLAEHRAGKLKSISWEVIGFGQKLAEQLQQELKVVLIGKAIECLADEVSRKCGQKVLTIISDRCEAYTPEAHCQILSQVAQQESPFLFLMGHTYQAVDFAPKLATMLGRGFIPNCVDYQIEAVRLPFVGIVFHAQMHQRGWSLSESPLVRS